MPIHYGPSGTKEIAHATADATPARFTTTMEAEGLRDFPLYVRFNGELMTRFSSGHISARYCGTVNVLEIFEAF